MQLEVLQSLALSVAQARSPQDVLREIVAGLSLNEGVALTRVWLVERGEGGEQYLQLKASVGASQAQPGLRWDRTDGEHGRVPIRYGKIGRIAASKSPLLLQRGAPDWLLKPAWADAEGIESFAGQPLCFGGELLGVLAVFSRRRIEPRELGWLRVFADHAAVAIGNARAFQEIAALKERLRQERDYLRQAVRDALHPGGLVAESAPMQQLLHQVSAVAQTDANVLIQGESGVGKELIASSLHEQSARADGPLVKVNCASIPRELFESEFFGHVRGAFSGASRKRDGRFLLADGGTLFLDEVGEIPLDLQGKLLRVLQEGTFEPVGDDRTRKVHVRLIAATNRDLMREVDAGRFRLDLYYRLCVFPLHLPPLRQRREDIVPLARQFLRTAALRFGNTPPPLSAEAESALRAYHFPGNVRELQNIIERAVVMQRVDGGPLRLSLTPMAPPTDRGRTPLDAPAYHERDRDLPREAGVIPAPAHGDHPPAIIQPATVPGTEIIPAATWRTLERLNLVRALERCQWRVAGEHGAAKLLGLKPSTLTYQMKAHNIERPGAR